MRRDELVEALDAYFRVPEIQNDDWSPGFEDCYPDPYWREFAEPGYEGRWNGLMVRGVEEIARAATCVFPSDRIVAGLEPGTFLFSEHPLDFGEVTGFHPLALGTFEAMRDGGVSFYNAHAPLDMHPEVSPSRLIAGALGLTALEEYAPIADGIPGGAAVIGESDVGLDELAERLATFLGPEIPVQVVDRAGRERAGRVAVVAGGGGDVELLEQSLERGCETYVTGNAARLPAHEFFRKKALAFRQLASERGVATVDGTHYGTEKPPQLEMAKWFRRLGLEADFRPDGPK